MELNPLTNRKIKTDGITYKKLQIKQTNAPTLQAAIKRNVDSEKLKETKKATVLLSSVLKRAVTKKPEAKPPDPKPKAKPKVKKVKPTKYGFEDLPEDVKNIISKNVKNNIDTKYTRENLQKLQKNVLYYLILENHNDMFEGHIHDEEHYGMNWYKWKKSDMIDHILEDDARARQNPFIFNKKYFDENQMIKEGRLSEKKKK